MRLPIFLAALAIIFDGLDNQILGFAIPAIIRDWHVSRASFGPIIATGLVGMGVGSALAGPIGDRLGRRTALIGTVLLFAAATTVTSLAHSLPMLALLRFLAGAGIGGAIPNATAIAAEFAAMVDHGCQQRLHRVAEFAHGHDAGHARAALDRMQVALQADQRLAFGRVITQLRPPCLAA